MKLNKMNNVTIIGLMLLCSRLVILFLDGILSYRQRTDFSPVSQTPASLDEQLALPEITGSSEYPVSAPTSVSEVDQMVSAAVHQGLGNPEVFQNLNVLEYLYTKNKTPELLQPLVEKFLQYYQFDKANTYLTLLVQQDGDYLQLKIDPRKVLYTRFHDSNIALDSNKSLDTVFALMKEYRTHNIISADDELFYNGLKSLWIYDYSSASAFFSKVTDPRYKDFFTSYNSALANFVKIKNPPLYYRDGLVALALLKNGYFVFAKRLALHALLKNKDYILPYQALAYTNFLTHNRESAKDYFLKLADFDTSNASLYKFLIGVSYYRLGEYEQSIIYLAQVTDSDLKVDVYRYLLLCYIQAEDKVNMTRVWHSLLGESHLQTSDFSLFFDQMFYVPFRTGHPFALYSDNQQLTDLYVGKCSLIFTGSQADVCLYGQVGLQLAQQKLSGIGQKLLSLIAMYHQSHLYHLLGDYYTSLKQYTLAKESYVKALSIADTVTEQTILQSKITKTTK